VTVGTPRIHYRAVDSTNARARELAERGAPHGTLVTAGRQTAGRGRQGRNWVAPAGRALLCSVVVRDPPTLLPLAAGIAVAEEVAPNAQLKWPNDVLVNGRKVAGILVESRPQHGWAVVGIGLNVAIDEQDFPPELRDRAAGLGRSPSEIEPTLSSLLAGLERWIAAPQETVLASLRARDALLGRHVRWQGGEGEAAGVDEHGRLVVAVNGDQVALNAGEVHLG
jgi:BirA family biotin operon repressor/biotin-[acetyl-CoA-carboxylase] ligase